MWLVHFFVTHIQTEKISFWNGPTVHVCCFMLGRASTKTFVSRIHIRQPSPKTAKKSSLAEKFVSRVTRQRRYHYTLDSNPHPNLIRTSFCQFIKRKTKKEKLVRGSNPHLSFNRLQSRAVAVGCTESHPGQHYRQIFQEVSHKQCFGRIGRCHSVGGRW